MIPLRTILLSHLLSFSKRETQEWSKFNNGTNRKGKPTHPSRQNIIDDDDPALELSADHGAALSMVLLLLSVVAEIAIDGVLLGQGHGSDGGEGDALVGGTEEDIKVGSNG